jgi:predicted transcriptional regulator
MIKTNRWTDKQVKELKTHYGHMELMDIAHMLGKTPSAVTSKVHYLRKRGWTFDSKSISQKEFARQCNEIYGDNMPDLI